MIRRLACELGAALVIGVGFMEDAPANESKMETKRVGEIGFTFVLPADFVQCEHAGEEGNTFRWSRDGLHVVYARDLSKRWKSVTETGQDFCPNRMNRPGVKIDFHSDPVSVELKAKAPERFGGVDFVLISGGTVEDVCALATSVIETFRFSNQATKLEIDFISDDASYFVVRNEEGQVRAARVGDVITRNQGRVDAISAHSVRVMELVPDGAGGYAEIPVNLNWNARRGGR